MVLTNAQAKAFYDRFGEKQDAQSFYEDSALDELVSHAAFGQAEKIFEFGCGTGRFASRLLAEHLSPSASYLGMDLSQTMVEIARQRIASYAGRAKVVQSDGSICFPLDDHSVDRVIATYVFDLLSEADIRQAISEAHRVLMPGGKLCLVSLAQGVSFGSRIVAALWSALFRLHAGLVGGCRPIQLSPLFEPDVWSVDYREIIVQFGVPSEVLIASPKPALGTN